ncbi:MAG TPA: hypothetical protein ACFCUD_05010 [Cyclobacteriaceae bacterium]
MSLIKGNRAVGIVSIALLVLCIFWLGTTPRYSNFIIFLYALSFVFYLLAYFNLKEEIVFFTGGIMARLLLLFTFPNLSDDFYRFIWDGRLINAGINPFSNLPVYYLTHETVPGLDNALFNKLNSPDYFTIYPPLNQLIFFLSAYLFPTSILGAVNFMRVILVTTDIGNYFLLRKLAPLSGLPKNTALLYFLNPLVIIETSGNLHFEGVMAFFLLLGLVGYHKQHAILNSLGLSAGIATKLIPIILLPSFLFKLERKNLIRLYVYTALFTILFFLPLVDNTFINGLSSSISLYFKKFEFNGSIYQIAREIGYWVKGYNYISRIGPLMGMLTFLSIMGMIIYNKNKNIRLEVLFLFSFIIYFAFATTVHPWYMITLVAISVLTRYRFPVIWSFLIFITYLGYQKNGGYEINVLWIVIEYTILSLFIIFEIYLTKLNIYWKWFKIS